MAATVSITSLGFILYVVDSTFDDGGYTTADFKICYVINDLPTVYRLNDRIVLFNFDMSPIYRNKIYKAVANQSAGFNAGEWVEDTVSPYTLAIELAGKDGELSAALADGKIVVTASSTAPLNPNYYDIWQCPAANVSISDLSPADAEFLHNNGTDDVYFYYAIGNTWKMCTAPMKSAIKDSQSTIKVKSQASVWNTVNVGTAKYVNGWQSILEYQNGGITKNDFAIIADNFYVGAVGNIVQNGVDSTGKPIYESTGEAYRPFIVDTVNHKIKFDGIVDFTNTNNFGTTTIDGGKITAGSISAGQLSATAISGKTITGGSIYGTTIEGVSILGSVIKSSWIDYTSIGALTNWQFYTPATMPSLYEANFAHNNTNGVLIADSNGYVRLPTTLNASSIYGMQTGSAAGAYSASAITLAAINGGIYSYSSYQISTTKRFVAITPSFDVVNQLEYIFDYEGTGGIM